MLELVTPSELAIGEWKIMRALGLANDAVEDLSEIDNYFKAQITLAGGPIIVRALDHAPDADSPANWALDHGLPTWQSFVRRMLDEGKLTAHKVPASGRRKVRLRRTERFGDPTDQ